MVASEESSVRTREFGARVRKIREGLGLTGQELAADLKLVGSTISRLEGGKRNAVGLMSLTALLTVCGLRGERLREYLAKWKAEDDGYFLSPHGNDIPDRLLALMIHERVATKIADFEPIFVPGLLQTEGYMRVLFEQRNASPEVVDRNVRGRIERQDVLGRSKPAPPACTFFIHENALRSPVGDNSVMHEQMVSLQLAVARPDITIRILPVSQHAASAVGMFHLMEFASIGPVGYMEGLGASAFFENDVDINMYHAMLNQLDEAALNEGHSAELLASLERHYGQP